MPSNKLVQSVTRALVILEYLAGAENGMTLQQLCQEVDLKPATAHNLLRTLTARGYVDHLTEPTRYALGKQFFELGDQHRALTTQRHAAQAVSDVFTQFKGVRVIYAEDVSGDVVLKLRMTPERPGLLERPWHSVMLAYTSATNLVFQALWREDQRLSYETKYPYERYGVHIWGDHSDFDKLLNEIREQNYAVLPPELNSEKNPLYRFAVPVFTSRHSLVGVLGAAFSESDVDDAEETKNRLIDCLKETAKTFSDI